MGPMAQGPEIEQRPRRNSWLPAFVIAIGVFAGSLLALAWVLFDVISDGETRASNGDEDPTPAATSSAETPTIDGDVTYSGPLPAGAEELGLIGAQPGEIADIEFVPGSFDGSVVVGHYAPVAALGTAVESLTREELNGLLTGAITDWSEVGGLPGAVHPIWVFDPAQSAVDGLPPLADPVPELMTSYDELRAAMTVDSGIVTIVPIEELDPSMMALAIDGVDFVRGVGDTGAWPYTTRMLVQANTDRGRSQASAIVQAIRAETPTITRVVATGDILMSRCSLARIEESGDWGSALRGEMGEYLAAADLTLGSLDGAIQDLSTPFGCVAQDYPNLSSPPEVREALTLAGFDSLTIATNHIFDCGVDCIRAEALLRTMELLEEVGIKTVGGGANLEEAFAPAIFEVNGITFGVLGFDDVAAQDLEATDTEPGTAPMDDSYDNERADPPAEPAFYKSASLLGVERLQRLVRELKEEVDVVIVQIQSGTEDTHRPSDRSLKGLRAAAEAGADLVVGNQAHWVQGLEVRDGVFIPYALGNFIFDQLHTPEHSQGYVLEATFHGTKHVAVRLLPYEIVNQHRPTFVDGDLRLKILGDVYGASVELSDREPD